jgi:hypothetical protein
MTRNLLRFPVALAVVAALAFVGSAAASGSGRTNVDFAGAPLAPRATFESIVRASSRSGGAPPIVLAAPARQVALVQWRGKQRPLLVAPTTGGGFCESLSGPYGGTLCRPGSARNRNGLNTGLTGDAGGPIGFNGSFLDARGTRLEVAYQDGRTSDIPTIWVSSPVRAGFFVFNMAKLHRRPGHRPIALSLFSTNGALLTEARIASYR